MVTEAGLGITDIVIQQTVGLRAFSLGRSYARSGRVRELSVDPGGRVLFAAVQGTRRSPYRVIVTPGTGRHRWAGRCTCPVSLDCKHVAAVMVAAQGGQRGQGAASAAGAGAGGASRVGTDGVPSGGRPGSSWEAPLAAVVTARARSSSQGQAGVPLALQVEVVADRVRLRPVMRGRSGGWVRSGASWADIEYSYLGGSYFAAHRAALRAIAAAHKAFDRSSTYRRDASVHLDTLGPGTWQLLEQARAAGVELVPAKAAAGVVVLAEPVGVALDLRREAGEAGAGAGDAGAATLTPVVTVGETALAASAVTLVGDPPHGLFSTDPVLLGPFGGGGEGPGLVLAPLQTPPDEHVAALLRAARPLEIPGDELGRFLGSYFPVLRQAIAVTSSDHSVELPDVTRPELAVTVRFEDGHEVGLDWSFTYRRGEREERVPVGSDGWDDDGWDDDAWDGDGWDGERPAALPGGVVRDPAAEKDLLAGLDEATRRLLEPDLRLTGMDTVGFTRDLLPVLRERDGLAVEVVGEVPDFREAELPPVIRLTTAETADDPDWFDLGVAVSVDGEEVPFEPLFVALAEQRSHLVLDSGTFLALDRPELEALRRLIDEARALQDRQSEGLRLSVWQAGLWEELLELGVVERQSARWAEAVAGLLGVEDLEPPPVPANFDAALRPYQLDGFRWLAFLWEHGLGGILADDMGLGKTIQALALMCHARESRDLPGPFLVVAPTSVVGNWAAEAARFAPGLKVRAVTETSARRRTPLAEDVAGADLVVTSYALFRIDIESYQGLPWAGLLLDEAQTVKNHQAKTYQCARRLAAPFKLAITGTPLENSLMDLWSLLSIVAPGLYPSPQRFTETYRKPIERGGDPDLLATLRRRIRPLMLRRTKEAVAAELPPKQEQVVDVVLNPKHQRVYQTHLQRERQKVLGLLADLDKNRFAIFRSLTLLRQLALAPSLVDDGYASIPSSKADAFLEQLEEVVAEGHRALVFSQFTGFLSVVRERLDAEGIRYCYLDGRTRKRAERIAEFKAGTAPVFLISLKAGGVGLNLTEADYCFILDPWWNPAVEAQAVDRTHRIGQDKSVMVYRLVATGTIEEKVMELKARKQALFSRVMDDDGLMSAPLTAEDIRGLFG